MMIHKIRTHKFYPVLLLSLLLSLLVFTVVYSANIDTNDKWAYGANIGWINFNDANGGVTVYNDHLEGYAWAENAGWIRLGSYDGGGAHTYANDAADTYGVNNDGLGNLSGYAWGANIGWINFNPSHGGVWIDPVSGDFDGYAWGENVGWIHFQNSSPAYKVNTTWRGEQLEAGFENDVAALVYPHATGPANSSGLTIGDNGFLNDTGDGIIFGHNNAAFAIVTDNMGSSAGDKRWARIWQLDVIDQVSDGGNVTLTFDISELGGQGSFDSGGSYYLLKRASGSSGDFTDVTVVGWSVSGDRLTFTVNASQLGSEFTLGASSASPTAAKLLGITAHMGYSLYLAIILAVLAVLGAIVTIRKWHEGESG